MTKRQELIKLVTQLIRQWPADVEWEVDTKNGTARLDGCWRVESNGTHTLTITVGGGAKNTTLPPEVDAKLRLMMAAPWFS